MITLDQARTLAGKTMQGSGGEKIGKIDTLYADRDGGGPTFATVHTGAFGTKISFVPLAEATMTEDGVAVPYDKDRVQAAPKIDPDSELDPSEEDRLYEHYGVTGVDDAGFDEGVRTGPEVSRSTGRDTSGQTTNDAMTRSEERLHVGTEKTEAGRARLRRYIVTDTETLTVPVSREEVRIEREPITDANRDAAYGGRDLSEEEYEVVLHAETPVVTKETVPVERVRLDTETVTEQATISEDVRKEQIETDVVDVPGDADRGAQLRR